MIELDLAPMVLRTSMRWMANSESVEERAATASAECGARVRPATPGYGSARSGRSRIIPVA